MSDEKKKEDEPSDAELLARFNAGNSAAMDRLEAWLPGQGG